MLFLGLCAVGFQGLRRCRIYSPTDVSKGLRLRVIGSLPNLTSGSLDGPELVVGLPLGKYSRGLVESVDGIRTRLLHKHPASLDISPDLAVEIQGEVLMVVSSGPGEGKTTLATQAGCQLRPGLAAARC